MIHDADFLAAWGLAMCRQGGRGAGTDVPHVRFDCEILGRVAQEVLGDRTLDALMAIALMLPVFFVSAAPCSRGHPAPQRLASPCTVRVHVCIGPGRGALTEAMLSVTLRTISS